MRKFLSVILAVILFGSFFILNTNATIQTPTPSGIDDSADYLLKVPDAGNYIYYSSSNWKGHGMVWSSFKNFGKTKFDPEQFLFNSNNAYIHTKTIDGENFYEAEFNMEDITFDTLDGCHYIGIQPMHIQFDHEAYKSGESVSLGNYIDTTPYKYVATRIKIVGGKEYQKKILSVMLRAAGRQQYIDNMVGTYIINNKTHKVTGPTPDMKYIEVENGFDGWIVMPVADMAEGKPLSELISVTFFCHSTGFDKQKCTHGVYGTAWDDSTLYIGDMMLVKDADKFNSARISCNIIGHKFGEPAIKPATTTSKGTSTITCSVCGKSEVTYISQLPEVISGSSVEGLAATAEMIGNTNVTSNVILKADNITSVIDTKTKNTIIRGVNTLSEKIKSRKLASILNLRLITRSKDSNGKAFDTEFKLNGKIKITVPIDIKAINNFKNINLVHVIDDENAKIINYTLSGDKAVFETDSLGYFAFVGGTKSSTTESSVQQTEEIVSNSSESSDADHSSSTVEKTDNDKTKNENKSDTNSLSIVLIVLASVIALGLIIFAIILFVKK